MTSRLSLAGVRELPSVVEGWFDLLAARITRYPAGSRFRPRRMIALATGLLLLAAAYLGRFGDGLIGVVHMWVDSTSRHATVWHVLSTIAGMGGAVLLTAALLWFTDRARSPQARIVGVLLGGVSLAGNVLAFPAPAGSWLRESAALAGDGAGTLLLVIVVVVGAGHLARRPVLRWSGVRVEARAGLCFLVAYEASGLATRILSSIFPSPSFPFGAHTGPNYLYETGSSALAGLNEEPLFGILIPSVVLATGKQTRRRWAVAVALSTVLRVLFHLYYRIPGLGLAIWAALAVVVVWRFNAIWGPIIAHTIIDLTVEANQFGSAAAAAIGQLFTVVALTVAVICALAPRFKTHNQPILTTGVADT